MSIQLIICLFDPYVVCSWNTEVEVVRKNFIGQDGRTLGKQQERARPYL